MTTTPQTPRDLARILKDYEKRIYNLERRFDGEQPTRTVPAITGTQATRNLLEGVLANNETTVGSWDASTSVGNPVSLNATTGTWTINQTGLFLVTASGDWGSTVPDSGRLTVETLAGSTIDGLWDARQFTETASSAEGTHTVANVVTRTVGDTFRLTVFHNGDDAELTFNNIVMAVLKVA